MKAISGNSHLPYCYNIACTRVYTNREAIFNDAFTPLVDLDVIFTTEALPREGTGDDSEQVYTSPHWHPLPDYETSPALLRLDGRLALIQENSSGSTDHATQLRRVAPFAAALQDILILHAASILCQDGLIAFIGPSGIGKTTLVEKLNQHGYSCPSDDLLPCKVHENEISIPLDPNLPLKGLYFLERDHRITALECTSISRHDCWLALLKHGFGELDAPEVWERQFLDYHHIARLVPTNRLTLPDNLSILENSLRELITLLEGEEEKQRSTMVEAIS